MNTESHQTGLKCTNGWCKLLVKEEDDAVVVQTRSDHYVEELSREVTEFIRKGQQAWSSWTAYFWG